MFWKSTKKQWSKGVGVTLYNMVGPTPIQQLKSLVVSFSSTYLINNYDIRLNSLDGPQKICINKVYTS
jgi:hypothetical protein